MQKQKIITVEGGTITVKELRVKDVRYLIDEAKHFENMDLKTLFFEHLDEVMAALKPLIDTDVPIDELSFSELEQIKEAFLAVNDSFLTLTGMADLLKPEPAPTAPVGEINLNERVSPLLSADTLAVLNTAGVSS